MMGLLVLGCTGMVVFLHSARFFFLACSHQRAFRSLSFLGTAGW